MKRSLPFFLAVALGAADANAAGLYNSDRGVRPLGRAGAFVAGADDLHAIWYNPAGLADAGSSVLVDFAWVNFSSEYTRRTQVTDAGGTNRVVEFPQVKGSSDFLPIPTIAGSYNFGKEKEYTAAFGIHAPYTAIASYPETLNGQPAPSRYSLVSLRGSALVVLGAYFAWKPTETFRIGGGVEALVGKFQSSVVFSASPNDRLISAPEDPSYDAASQLDVGPIIAPSANAGMTWVPTPAWHLGLSGQLPTWINSPAKVNVRLPTAAPFDNAYQDGNEARVKFRLPAIVRGGVEYRTNIGKESTIRLEGTYVREFWSLHDTIDIESRGIRLYDITGFPSPFGVGKISIPRGFQDSNSFRLGTELGLRNVGGYWIDLRAGLAYDTSAIPNDYVSPLTYDSNKITGTFGGSLHVGKQWRMDAVAAYTHLGSETVEPQNARVPRINPVRGNPTDTESINGGTYHARAIILGVGVNYRFGQ